MAEETISPFSPPKADLEGVTVTAGGHTLAQRGTRLAAVLLDGVVTLPAGLMGLIAVVLMRGDRGVGLGAGICIAVAGIWMAGTLVYQIYLLSTLGQTMGKRWMKIRIVKLDGTSPGFVGAVLLRIFVGGLISAVPYLGSLYGLVDTLFIFREDRRCLHDFIAGTRVVVANA